MTPDSTPTPLSPNSKRKRMTDKQINLKLPDALWLAAKIKAAQNRISLSAAIRELLAKWTSGHLSIEMKTDD